MKYHKHMIYLTTVILFVLLLCSLFLEFKCSGTESIRYVNTFIMGIISSGILIFMTELYAYFHEKSINFRAFIDESWRICNCYNDFFYYENKSFEEKRLLIITLSKINFNTLCETNNNFNFFSSDIETLFHRKNKIMKQIILIGDELTEIAGKITECAHHCKLNANTSVVEKMIDELILNQKTVQKYDVENEGETCAVFETQWKTSKIYYDIECLEKMIYKDYKLKEDKTDEIKIQPKS